MQTTLVDQGNENFNALHEYVLTFMGAFSSTQFAIDNVLGLYLRRQMPQLGPELERQFLRKVRDDQRLSLFAAFAAQADYQENLANFTRIYQRAKQLRDMTGHSLGIAGPVKTPGELPTVAVTRASRTVTNLIPKPLVPSTFVRMTADCEWLTQHVHRAGYAAEPQMFVDFRGRPSEPPIPTPLPENGEPLG